MVCEFCLTEATNESGTVCCMDAKNVYDLAFKHGLAPLRNVRITKLVEWMLEAQKNILL